MSSSSAKPHAIFGSTQNCCIAQHIYNTNNTNIGNGSTNHFWNGSELIACDAGNDERSRVSHHGLESSCKSSAFYGIGRFPFHKKLTSGNDDVQCENNNNETDSDTRTLPATTRVNNLRPVSSNNKVFGENPKRPPSEQMEREFCRPQKRVKSDVPGGVAGGEEGDLEGNILQLEEKMRDLKLDKATQMAHAVMKGELLQATSIIRNLKDKVDTLEEKLETVQEEKDLAEDNLNEQLDSVETQLGIESGFSATLNYLLQGESSKVAAMEIEIARLEDEVRMLAAPPPRLTTGAPATAVAPLLAQGKANDDEMAHDVRLEGGGEVSKCDLAFKVDRLEDAAAGMTGIEPQELEEPHEETETNSILQSLAIGAQAATHLDHARKTLESDQPPCMKVMTEFLLSQEVGGPTFTGTLYPISSIIEGSRYLRMLPDKKLLSEGGHICSRYEDLYRSVDPIRHMYTRLEGLVRRLLKVIRDDVPKNDDEDGSWLISITDSDGEDERLSTRAQRIFELTGWTWDTIRAFTALVDDYLVQTGSSMDDFMNRSSKSSNKGELCHASDPLRNLTWFSGTKPTQEQQRLFIKKMCSPLILFAGSLFMNRRMDNRQVYDLEYGTIVCASTGVSIDNWSVHPTQNSSRNARLEMARLEMIQLMMPSLSSATLRQNTVFVPNTDGIGDESEDESDGDESVNVGQLDIRLITTKNVAVGGEVTLKYLGPNEYLLFSVIKGENVIGYVNQHDQEALFQFMNDAGRHVSAISNVTLNVENEGEESETLIQWKGGTIIRKDGRSCLQFPAIDVKTEHAESVVQGLHELGSHREQSPFSPMNPHLIAKEVERVKEIHRFIEKVQDGSFLPNMVPQPWDGQSNTHDAEARESSWYDSMECIQLLFRWFPSLRGRSWNGGKVTRYLSGEGPGRADALAAFNEAWPASCKWFWVNEMRGFQKYAVNPQGYRGRIEFHRIMGTLDESLEYDYSIPLAPTQGIPTNDEVVILRSDTIDIMAPSPGEYMVVCGNQKIAKSVMGGQVSGIEKNDAGIRTTVFWAGRLRLLGQNRQGWAVRLEDGLNYIARSRIPGTDLDEGIYCDPSELPAPWRFVLHEHYLTSTGRRPNINLSNARLEEIHNEKSEAYIENGVIPGVCEKTYVRAGTK